MSFNKLNTANMSVSKEEAIDPILDKYLAAGKPMRGADLKQLIFDCMDAWVTAQLSAPNTGKGGVSFLQVLQDNYQAQIAGFYNVDKTDSERAKRNAVIEEYQDLIAIFKSKHKETPPPISVGDGWVKCEDSPLYTSDKDDCWTLTENGGKEFLAAIPYENSSKPDEKNLWWIRHCVIDDSGLRVVTDDDTEPAGYSLSDVTHYKLILPPPPVE